MNAEKNMTPRLLAIADCVSQNVKIADVGTDHAYIPIYLVQKGKISSALAMDINRGPLLRAENNIAKFQLQENIVTRLSDGIKELKAGEADEIIIAGMGGILICEILEAKKELLTKDVRLILQPMTAAEEVRKYLHHNGFCIKEERLAKEGNKIYQILTAQVGDMEVNREADYYISPYLLTNHVPLAKEFLIFKIREFEKILRGLTAAKRENANDREVYVRNLLDELYEIKEECGEW